MLSGIICPVRQPYEDRWMTEDLIDLALVKIPGWLLPQAAFFQGLATWGPMVYVVVTVVKTIAKWSAWQMQHNLWVHNETRNVSYDRSYKCLIFRDLCPVVVSSTVPFHDIPSTKYAVATVVEEMRNSRHTKKGTHKLTGAYRNNEWMFLWPITHTPDISYFASCGHLKFVFFFHEIPSKYHDVVYR